MNVSNFRLVIRGVVLFVGLCESCLVLFRVVKTVFLCLFVHEWKGVFSVFRGCLFWYILRWDTSRGSVLPLSFQLVGIGFGIFVL